MKTFWVSGTGTVTFTVQVEAESAEEAKILIEAEPLVGLHWDTEEVEIHDAEEVEMKKVTPAGIDPATPA